MATLPQGFSARSIEPQGNSSQFPVSPAEGWRVVIVGSEMKQVKDKPGMGYLELLLQIIEGEHINQQGYYRLNLYHENAKTVEIANRQLSALCWVCGNPDAVDSAQLHNIPFRAIVGLQKKKQADDPDYTEIKGVKDDNGNDPGKSNGSTAPAQPVAPPVPPAAQAAPAQNVAPQNAPQQTWTPAPASTPAPAANGAPAAWTPPGNAAPAATPAPATWAAAPATGAPAGPAPWQPK